ncbi:MAG: hypothetical protein IAE82_16735 [Opitutaceae bacterium]|nr:hypothetical protein [Opitutaceae bacterium]
MKKRILLTALTAAAAWWWYARAHAPADWPGQPAAEPPHQDIRGLPAAWRHADYTIAPLARFTARAVVLSRCDYSGGHDGELAPTDFALGWGRMSEAGLINRLNISQDMRWFLYSWRGELPVAGHEIARSCANMHLIPGSDAVARELARTRRHDLVELSGYLVEARHADGWTWRSSLSREDSGAGACEVVWVESVNRMRPAPP